MQDRDRYLPDHPQLRHGWQAFPCGACTRQQGSLSYDDGRVVSGTICELDHVCWDAWAEFGQDAENAPVENPAAEDRAVPEFTPRPEKPYPGAPFQDGCVACGRQTDIVVDGYASCDDHLMLVFEKMRGQPFPWERGEK